MQRSVPNAKRPDKSEIKKMGTSVLQVSSYRPWHDLAIVSRAVLLEGQAAASIVTERLCIQGTALPGSGHMALGDSCTIEAL